MRIGLVSQWYPPEVPALVPSTWSRGLASRGHEVHVVTGVPNYPSGRVYDGYSVRPYAKESDGSITVHRGFLYPSHDSNAVRRAANYLSFSAGGTWAASHVPEPDVWLTNGTPATAAVPSIVNRKLGRGAHAMVIQDLWPESVTQSGFVEGSLRDQLDKIIGNFCKYLYRNTDAIGVISPGMRDVLIDRGVNAEKIYYTPNPIDDAHLLPAVPRQSHLRNELGLPEGRLFMYAGNFGRMQNLDNLISAFAKVPEANLVLVGSGVVEDNLKAAAQNIGNVYFVERKSISVVGKYIAASDIQIVSLQDTPLLRVTMPSKFQACLAAARPVLAHAAGDVAAITANERVGYCANPEDPDEAAVAIQRFTQSPYESLIEMGERARNLYERDFSAQAGIRRLETLMSTAVINRRQRMETQ